MIVDWNQPFGADEPAPQPHPSAPSAEPAGDFAGWIAAVAADGRPGWQAPEAPRLAWWRFGAFEDLAEDWRAAIRATLRRRRPFQ